ncbi:MAG: carbamoyltransferase HypF [Eubacterium sp.]|nr:carbamoyltransferase HypF [Eubacterium sp.]
MSDADILKTKQIKIYGIVQGVGFRPTVSRYAKGSGICGTVCNKGSFVEVIAQGTERAIESFLLQIREQPPERAVILKMDVRDAAPAIHFSDFSIVESEKKKGEIFVSPDIALCDTCRAELLDPKNRRYLHPFINCTSCGPRLTILESLPYDRERTSMKVFPMCRTCHKEYVTPTSRRYDAQPVCCNDCGPQVYILPKDGTKPRVTGREAIIETRHVLLQGGIAAVKGIGGFHLCCDAGNTSAVLRLRALKQRPHKPFAVMMRDEDAVLASCEVSDSQREILTGHQKPILLLNRKKSSHLSEAVAPDNPKVGVMLPYAPVQVLLFQYDDGQEMPSALIMTSGNVSGAPICHNDREAAEELGGIADIILSNNRRINIRCDDSVMDFYRGKPYMIRRSRGYAPLPYMVTAQTPVNHTVLAVGGELKNTFCIGKGNLFYPSSYIGDLADVRSTDALLETIGRYETLLEAKPDRVICDLHPGYRSTGIAEKLAADSPSPVQLVRVQHHYAHILSCMAENDYLDPVLGVSFDGTGYGSDGTIWGGEILLADVHSFRRVGSVKPFLHVGGDTASREGWRIACSMICDLFKAGEGPGPEEVMTALQLCPNSQAGIMRRMHDKRFNAIVSTSCGRIFDAASAILGICRRSGFEGEASTALMYRAQAYLAQNGPDSSGLSQFMDAFDYDPADTAERALIRTDYIVKELVRRRLAGEDPDRLAWLFHAALAESTCHLILSLHGADQGVPETVALSGGCFQNTLLLDLVQSTLEKNGFRVLVHSLVPPNDGGIALGQALYGACMTND